MRLDFDTFSNSVGHNYNEFIEPLRNLQMKPYNSDMIKIFKSSTFDPDLKDFDLKPYISYKTSKIIDEVTNNQLT